MITSNNIEDIAFGRFDDLHRLYGISRSMAYVLLKEGSIRSRLIKPKGGSRSKLRLIDFSSVREYLAQSPETPSRAVSREMSRRGSMPWKRAHHQTRK
jgi:hypothetical protein